MSPKGDGAGGGLAAGHQASPKYGTSAVRDVTYVSSASKQAKPTVEVKQRKNGQYVVVERFPVHHKRLGRNHGLPTLQQSLAESEVKLNSLKPDWKPTSKIRDDHKGKAPVVLPPIDLGYKEKAQAQVGSLDNVHHSPRGGNKPILNQKLHWEASAKIGSLDNVHYKGPPSTTQSEPVHGSSSVSERLKASPRYGALAATGALGPNMHYTPGGAEVYQSKATRFDHVTARVGSLDNVAHVPGGGDFKVHSQPMRWRSEARVGSLDYVRHVPLGGDITIPTQRLHWMAKPKVGSLDNITHKPKLGPVQLPHNHLAWEGKPRVGSLDNIHHKPGGGLINITNNRLRWNAVPKIDSRPPKRRISQTSSLDSLDSY